MHFLCSTHCACLQRGGGELQCEGVSKPNVYESACITCTVGEYYDRGCAGSVARPNAGTVCSVTRGMMMCRIRIKSSILKNAGFVPKANLLTETDQIAYLAGQVNNIIQKVVGNVTHCHIRIRLTTRKEIAKDAQENKYPQKMANRA